MAFHGFGHRSRGEEVDSARRADRGATGENGKQFLYPFLPVQVLDHDGVLDFLAGAPQIVADGQVPDKHIVLENNPRLYELLNDALELRIEPILLGSVRVLVVALEK